MSHTNLEPSTTEKIKMNSPKAATKMLLFSLFAFVMGDSSVRKTLCGAEEKSKAFLDMAVDFIEKAKQNIPLCTMDGNKHFQIKPVDCEELLLCGYNQSGVYTIWPRNKIIKGSVEVYCDMNTDEGGWTVIQRRGNYGREKDYFFKDWENYQNGFGDIEKDFWLGNDLIFAISNQRVYSVRFDLRDIEGSTRYALYDRFWIEDEKEQYRLHIKDYSGDAGDGMIKSHDSQKFSTKDRDNDLYESNCAEAYKGGWWYGSCHSVNLNGLYLSGKHESYADGINWQPWKGYHESLDTTEIKIRPKDFRKSAFQTLTPE